MRNISKSYGHIKEYMEPTVKVKKLDLSSSISYRTRIIKKKFHRQETGAGHRIHSVY